jgi:putative flavoprotein involved in K+ transport
MLNTALDAPIPNASVRTATSVNPGAFAFVGLLFLYSLSSALLGGVGRDAKYIVEHIVSTWPTRMGWRDLMS